MRVWFETWGLVHQARAVSGDSSAMPSFSHTVEGTTRGSPSDPSDCQMRFCEVEAFLRTHATPRHERLMAFVFCLGIHTTERYQLQFEDGSFSDWLGALPEPLSPHVAHIETTSKSSYRYDLNEFDAPELRVVADMWHCEYGDLLESHLLMLARWFGKDKEL